MINSICKWIYMTFGVGVPGRLADRVEEELNEFRANPSEEEAADVLISACGLYLSARKLEFSVINFEAVVARKMEINKDRKWQALGDGTGYHIKEGDNHASD